MSEESDSSLDRFRLKLKAALESDDVVLVATLLLSRARSIDLSLKSPADLQRIWKDAKQAALKNIAERQAEFGEIAFAIKLGSDLSDPQDRAWCLRSIAIEQASSSSVKCAHTFELAVHASGQIENRFAKVLALIAIAESQSETGHKESADKSILSAFEAARMINDPEEMSAALYEVNRSKARVAHGTTKSKSKSLTPDRAAAIGRIKMESGIDYLLSTSDSLRRACSICSWLAELYPEHAERIVEAIRARGPAEQ